MIHESYSFYQMFVNKMDQEPTKTSLQFVVNHLVPIVCVFDESGVEQHRGMEPKSRQRKDQTTETSNSASQMYQNRV